MKITDTRARNTRFEDLAYGDTFMWTDDLMMKTPQTTIDGELFNAWSFKDNTFEWFDEDVIVTKANAEIIIS